MTSTLEDRFAIMELMARYSQLVSDRRYDEFGALYTDDGGLEDENGVRGLGGAGMADYVRSAQESWGPFKQLNVNHLIEIDGDVATGSSDYFIFRRLETAIVATAAGRYNDTYRRTADGWRFVTRRITRLPG